MSRPPSPLRGGDCELPWCSGLRSASVFDDGQARCFDIKRLPFACAALRIDSSHAVANDSERSIVRHDPLRNEEVAFGLFCRLTITHWKVDSFAGVVQVYGQLGC